MDIVEIRLARILECAIEEAFRNGEVLPPSVLETYAELKKHWDWQMSRELS